MYHLYVHLQFGLFYHYGPCLLASFFGIAVCSVQVHVRPLTHPGSIYIPIHLISRISIIEASLVHFHIPSLSRISYPIISYHYHPTSNPYPNMCYSCLFHHIIHSYPIHMGVSINGSIPHMDGLQWKISWDGWFRGTISGNIHMIIYIYIHIYTYLW